MSLVVVARFMTLGEVQAARSAVDAAGFFVRIADENVVGIEWLYSNAVGGVKLLVREEDREQVAELLEREAVEPSDESLAAASEETVAGFIPEPDPEAPSPSGSDTAGLQCPRCGRTELHYIHYYRLQSIPLLFVLTAVVVVPIWLLLPKKRCDHCGLRQWVL